MNGTVSASMDTSGLERVIPQLVAFGRRTLQEQCVTSMGMILQDAQNQTPYVDIGRMDAELDAPAENERLARLGFTVGDEIVLARANPDSKFNKMTGGRWALQLPSGGIRGFGRAYGHENAVQMFLQSVIVPIMERMRAGRHSSGHFLQSGYKDARDECVTSPFFKNRYRARTGSANDNSLNTLDSGKLGGTVIELRGDECVVTSMNNVGEDGHNDVLDKKHRDALIEYSAGPLQDAVNRENSACSAELDRRMSEKWPMFSKMLD